MRPLRTLLVRTLLVRILLVAAVLEAAGGGSACPAQLLAIDLPDEGGPGLVLSGVIAPGDEAVFHALADTLGRAVVVTTGPGGSVSAAIAIGSETRARGWSTLVPEGATCASACAFIWLAGRTRALAEGARIGFHALATVVDGRRAETHEFDSDLRRWLTSLGYPQDAAATITNTRAASIRWFDAAELRANGIPTDPVP